MTKKTVLILAVLAIILLTATALLRIAIFKSEIPPPAPAKEIKQPKEEPVPGYEAPANTIPSLDEISAEAENKKSEKEKTDAMIKNMRTEQAKKREVLIEQYKEELKAESQKPPAKTTEIKEIVVPTRKKVIIPTAESKERMKAQGVVAY